MKWIMSGLVLAMGIGLATPAQAQFVFYGHKGKHHAWGIALDFTPPIVQPLPPPPPPPQQVVIIQQAPPVMYAPPVQYGYHAHESVTEYTPYGVRETRTYHYGPVHPEDHTDVIYQPAPYGYAYPSYAYPNYYGGCR